ncbi:hypothetical protein BGZ81_006776 [Podila clonocystis]|nr:hypothetical protein BGZ81_006776 [Podila clonocystis]
MSPSQAHRPRQTGAYTEDVADIERKFHEIRAAYDAEEARGQQLTPGTRFIGGTHQHLQDSEAGSPKFESRKYSTIDAADGGEVTRLRRLMRTSRTHRYHEEHRKRQKVTGLKNRLIAS